MQEVVFDTLFFSLSFSYGDDVCFFFLILLLLLLLLLLLSLVISSTHILNC